MREIRLLLAGASVLLLPMCNQVEGPLPAGTVQAADSKADALMREAEMYRAKGKISKYESRLSEIIHSHALAPCAPQARLLLGESLQNRKRYRDAFDEYSKIVEKYQGSELYAKALQHQHDMAIEAANGTIKGRVMWLWDVPMETDVVVKWLQSVIRNAPYGDMAAKTTAVLGDYLMRQERFDEAAAVYRKLVEDYPDSKYAPNAQIRVAELWAASHTRGNQNLVNLDKAREAYDEFSLLFPKHDSASKARDGSLQVQRKLVQQELDVGRYYLERAREYASAAFCFESVIRKKDINPEAAAEATKLLAKAKAHLAKTPR